MIRSFQHLVTTTSVIGTSAVALALLSDDDHNAEEHTTETSTLRRPATTTTLESSSSSSSSHHNPTILPSERRAARILFNSCQSCHVGLPLGPPFWRDEVCLFDQPAGSVYPDYPFTNALKNSGIIWNETTLDEWLQDPAVMIPGNYMSIQGIDDPEERQEMIAIMKSFCNDDNTTNSTSTTESATTDEDPTTTTTAAPSADLVLEDKQEEASASADHHFHRSWIMMTPTVLMAWLFVQSTRR